MSAYSGMAARMMCLLAMIFAAPAIAQDNYPSSTVRLIMGFPPGGSTDVVARLLAQKLSAQMNASVIVDYRIGNEGHIGADYVAKARPDGHTVFMNVPSQILGPAFNLKLSYDVFRDLAPLSLLSNSPQLLVMHPSLPVSTPAEFIAFIRQRPDKLAYSSAGPGSVTHLSPLLFLQTNRLNALHIPFKGSGPAMVGLVTGETQFAMQSIVSVLPMIKQKRLKAIAISSLKRSPLLPEAPTLSETVMPKFEVGSWVGALVPARTPPAIIRRLNDEMVKALHDPAVKSLLDTQGIESLGTTHEEYGNYLRGEFERWSKVIKAAGLKVE